MTNSDIIGMNHHPRLYTTHERLAYSYGTHKLSEDWEDLIEKELKTVYIEGHLVDNGIGLNEAWGVVTRHVSMEFEPVANDGTFFVEFGGIDIDVDDLVCAIGKARFTEVTREGTAIEVEWTISGVEMFIKHHSVRIDGTVHSAMVTTGVITVRWSVEAH